MSLLRFPLSPQAPREIPWPTLADTKVELRFAPLPFVSAIKDVGRLRGSTEPHLMRADDGAQYVVKFGTNPFGPRVLVDEYLCYRLARGLTLTTPDAAIVATSAALGVAPGLQFGSRLHKSRGNVYVNDWVPEAAWTLVENKRELIGAYVFDVWVSNGDTRQFIFARTSRAADLRLYLIDNSHCFGAKSWRLTGVPIQCPHQMQFAYAAVTKWSDFEPWLSMIENLDEGQVQRASEGIPDEWLPDAERAQFHVLLDQLYGRRREVRGLIAGFLDRGHHPFAGWRYRSSLFVAPAVKHLGKTA